MWERFTNALAATALKKNNLLPNEKKIVDIARPRLNKYFERCCKIPLFSGKLVPLPGGLLGPPHSRVGVGL